MDTVTYPDPAVERDLNAHFVGLKIDLVARHPDLKEASGSQRVGFAPAFVFTESGREIRRWIGWLPPTAFRAELAFVRASAAWLRGDAADAAAQAARIAGDFAATPV